MGMEYQFGGQIAEKLTRLINPDFRTLMAKWGLILREDNIRGVMAGTDGNDVPLEPVKYRNGIAAPVKRRNRYSHGIGLPRTPGSTGENLATAQYKQLGGPPLAPRGKESRVIRNYEQNTGQSSPTEWFAEGAWLNVLSKKGIPFLTFHFNGKGRNPRRDLRGVRAWGRAEALKELKAEVNRMLRNQ